MLTSLDIENWYWLSNIYHVSTTYNIFSFFFIISSSEPEYNSRNAQRPHGEPADAGRTELRRRSVRAIFSTKLVAILSLFQMRKNVQSEQI